MPSNHILDQRKIINQFFSNENLLSINHNIAEETRETENKNNDDFLKNESILLVNSVIEVRETISKLKEKAESFDIKELPTNTSADYQNNDGLSAKEKFNQILIEVKAIENSLNKYISQYDELLTTKNAKQIYLWVFLGIIIIICIFGIGLKQNIDSLHQVAQTASQVNAQATASYQQIETIH